MSFDSKIPVGKNLESLHKKKDTDFGPVDFYVNDDIYIPSRYTLDLSKVIKDTLFDFTSLLSFSSTDFKQDALGNCWEVAVMKALFDKPFALQFLQEVLIPSSDYTWRINRLTRSNCEVYCDFDIRDTFFKSSYVHYGKKIESFFLYFSKDPIYLYFVYGILKAMDSLIRLNKLMYYPDEFIKSSDTMQLSDGYFSLSVMFYLFKNIVKDLGRMRFSSESYRYYSMFFEGLISYEDLRNADFRVFEMLEILKSMELNPNKYICIVSFASNNVFIDVLGGSKINLFTNHAYYLKSYNSSINFVTLIDPNNQSLQFHLSFHDFMFLLFDFEYAEFPDSIVDLHSCYLTRVAPLSTVEHAPQVDKKTFVQADLEVWVDFNHHMVISNSVSKFHILMNKGEYRLYDINAAEFLPLMTLDDIGLVGESLARFSFKTIFENPYKEIFSYAHHIVDSVQNLSGFIKFAVTDGYLCLKSPIEILCEYPDLVRKKGNCTVEIPFKYKFAIDPIFARCFADSGYSSIQIYQTQSNLKEFIFVVNSVEYKFNRDLFEIGQFFNLETLSLAPYRIFDDRIIPGFKLGIQHYSYDNVKLKINFQNVTTQFFA